jgi:hypothetical protein
MKTKIFISCIILLILLLTGDQAGCSQNDAIEVTFDQLFADSGKYNNNDITIEGFFFHGFETIILSESLETSGLAPDHLVPKGRMIWIEGGIPKNLEDQLYQQQQSGSLEVFGKVRITGRFEYGGEYGHLGGFTQQITPREIALLPWSLKAS